MSEPLHPEGADVQTLAPRRRHLVDLTPLRESPPFARMWIGAAITGIGGQMTIVAVGLHIYDLTASTFAVALLGLVALGPMILSGLYGGALADTFDRRRVALLSAIVAWASTAVIALLAWLDVQEVWPLYLLSTLNAVSSTLVGVARQAIVPRLLRPDLLPAASALGGIAGGAMVTVGPALAGVLVAYVGIAWTYTIDVVLFLAAFLGLWTLPAVLPEGERRRPGWGSVAEGIRFLRAAPNIRTSFLIDIAAMTFGNPRALFPAAGALLLGGGPVTVGVLTASGAVGTLLLSVFSGRLSGIRHHGRATAWGVACYGLAILGFGITLLVAQLVPHDAGEDIAEANLVALVIAALFFAVAGAADNVSMIFRNTMMQAAVPDSVRGRTQGIFTVVVTGGPRLGDLYVGLLTLAGALWFPPLLGGILIVGVTVVLLRSVTSFRDYDARDPRP